MFSHSKKVIRTVAGVPTFAGDGNLAVNANLNEPNSLFVTANNEVYIADTSNHVIRKVNRNGIISTVAGIAGRRGFFGENVPSTEAIFFEPKGILVTPYDDIIVSDSGNNKIRKISKQGNNITTIVGCEKLSSEDCNGDSAVTTQLFSPSCLFYKDDVLYFCDALNFVIRKLYSNGTVTIVAGILGHSEPRADTNIATETTLYQPNSIYVTATDEIYIADSYNCVIRKVFANGTITTVVGHTCGYSEKYDVIQFSTILGIHVLESQQIMIIADSDNCLLRKLFLKNNTVVTIGGVVGFCNHTGNNELAIDASFNTPKGLFISPYSEEIYVADSGNNVIRIIGTDGMVRAFAGKYTLQYEYNTIHLYYPKSMYMTNDSQFFIADTRNRVIKKMNSNGTVTIVAGIYKQSGISAENQTATQSLLRFPSDIVVNEYSISKELYISDSNANLIKKVEHGIMTTVAKNFIFDNPTGLAISKYQELYIADSYHDSIQKLFLLNQTIETISLDLHHPTRIALNSNHQELYIAENGAIKKIFLTNHTMITIVGWTEEALVQQLITPFDIAMYNDQLYWSDTCAIFTLINSTQIVQVIGDKYMCGYIGEDTDVSMAIFSTISKLFFKDNSMYIVDNLNHVIRKATDLCSSFSFDSHWNVNEITSIRRCNQMELIDYFELNYLPILELYFKNSNTLFKTIVFNWNQKQVLSSLQLSDQKLDMIDMKLNQCNDLSRNCTVIEKEYGIIPSNSTSNLLFVSDVTVIKMINYYKLITSAVKNFQMQIIITNRKTNQIEQIHMIPFVKEYYFSKLQHSTTYRISINSTIIYKNDLLLQSLLSTQMITTTMGILPGTVSQLKVEYLLQNNLLFVSWNPIQELGNTNIEKLHLEYKTNQQVYFDKIELLYNANSNSPNSYSIGNVTENQMYQIRIRVCSEIGCSNYTTIVSTFVPLHSNYITTTVLVCFLFLVLVLLFVIFFILIIIIVSVIIYRKFNTKLFMNTTDSLQNELMEHSIINQFKIEESKLDFSNSTIIGCGASGTVIKANYYNIFVAVKLVAKTVSGLENDLSDFYNELQFLNSNTQHVNIIRFFGVYESREKNQIGLVMEYCCNGDVANYVSKNLSFDQKLQFIKGIANGMQYLHFHNIAHRDLKCENVLLDSNLTPKIIDFGYSRIISAEANKSMNLTMNIGTAAYCAPEVIKSMINPLTQNKSSNNSNYSNSLTEPLLDSKSEQESTRQTLAYDKKCDVYSFAICIWVIYFQQKNPYGTLSDNQILYHLSYNCDFRPTVFELKNEEEKWIIDLMKQCWSTNPNYRPSFDQICNTLSKK